MCNSSTCSSASPTFGLCLFTSIALAMALVTGPWGVYYPCPAPQGGIPGPCPPKLLLVPPQTRIVSPKPDLCSKEIDRLGAAGVQSRPETPKILVTTPEFVSKNCFFLWSLQLRPFVFVISPQNS